MGKKYIIELNPDCVEGEYLRIPARIAGEEQWLVTKAALTPYTEPDLEQVRKEAYEDGYNTGFGRKIDASYQEGLSDAWDAARRIIRMPEGDLLNVFTECYSAVCTALQVVLKYDASECIEKIQAYEQEEIKVGDEVESTFGKGVVVKVEKEHIGYIYEDGSWGFNPPAEVAKTGRHFPEIATILEKIRGEQDG